jgi:zinc transport system ATP-binding protein
MYKLIHDLNKQGITIIMISHDVGCALKYASHILHIGEKTFFGTKKEYLQSNVGRIFLAEQEEYARNA